MSEDLEEQIRYAMIREILEAFYACAGNVLAAADLIQMCRLQYIIELQTCSCPIEMN